MSFIRLEGARTKDAEDVARAIAADVQLGRLDRGTYSVEYWSMLINTPDHGEGAIPRQERNVLRRFY